MLILTIRTDNPKAELGLYNNESQLARHQWEAHRKLAESIHTELKQLLDQQGKTFHDLQGIVIFKGPGSFTGLRIGFSVANAMADSLNIPIIASQSENWQKTGVQDLLDGKSGHIALPEYGSLPHTTTPKK
jgi:tRNA threonylcarbamoyladenosine biosynthesis protein TsaB